MEENMQNINNDRNTCINYRKRLETTNTLLATASFSRFFSRFTFHSPPQRSAYCEQTLLHNDKQQLSLNSIASV